MADIVRSTPFTSSSSIPPVRRRAALRKRPEESHEVTWNKNRARGPMMTAFVGRISNACARTRYSAPPTHALCLPTWPHLPTAQSHMPTVGQASSRMSIVSESTSSLLSSTKEPETKNDNHQSERTSVRLNSNNSGTSIDIHEINRALMELAEVCLDEDEFDPRRLSSAGHQDDNDDDHGGDHHNDDNEGSSEGNTEKKPRKRKIDSVRYATVAQFVLEQLENSLEPAPNTATYNAVLQAWSNTACTLPRGRGRLGDFTPLHANMEGDAPPILDEDLIKSVIVDELQRARDEDAFVFTRPSYLPPVLRDFLSSFPSFVAPLETPVDNGSDGQSHNEADEAYKHPFNHYIGRDAALAASSLMKYWEYRVSGGDGDIPGLPDREGYNAVVMAWARCRANDGAEQAEKIVARMEAISAHVGGPQIVTEEVSEDEQDESEDDDEDLRTDDVVSPSLSAWPPDLAKLVQPDTETYNCLLESWAQTRSAKGLEKAQAIFDILVDDYERNYIGGNATATGIKPNIKTVNVVIKAHVKAGAGKDFDRYTLLAESKKKAISPKEIERQQMQLMKERNSGIRRLAEQSEDLLRDAQRRWQETGDQEWRPVIATYTSVIDAYSRCGDLESTQHAARLLKELEEIYESTGDASMRPNSRAYSALVAAWSKTNDPDAAVNSEALLRRMHQLQEEAEARGEVLEGDERIKPTTRTYTSVIAAWARSNDDTKHQRALRLLKEMNEMYKQGDEAVKPNLYTYNAAIDACARTQGTMQQRGEALKIAFAVNKALNAAKGVAPNFITYASLLKAAQHLIPYGNERDDVIRAVLTRCIKDGQFGRPLIRIIELSVNRRVFRDLFAEALPRRDDTKVTYENIPESWKRNVRPH